MKRTEPFVSFVAALKRKRVRFLVIGVWGMNYYGSGSTHFYTEDRDFFLPADPANELKAWRACRDAGFELVSRRALVRADGHGLLATHEEALRELGRRRRGRT